MDLDDICDLFKVHFICLVSIYVATVRLRQHAEEII